MNAWIKAAELAALPASGMTRVQVENEAVLLVRDGECLRAFQADCPHAGAPLEEGALCNGRIVCPWHKAVFAADSGAWIEPPALASLKTWPVKVESSSVFVDLRPGAPAAAAVRRGSPQRFAIIGGGAAAASAVATLLDNGFDGELTVFAAEPEAPYDRTCLSKYVPSGEMKPDEVPPLLSEETARDERLRIEHTEVLRFDTALKRVTLADGRETAFDAALVATGSVARRPDMPGAELERVFTLRTLLDAKAIFEATAPGEHVVMLGDSFISLETASALRKLDVRVTVVTPSGVPLRHALGARVGSLFREWHEAHGVVFHRAKALRLDGRERVESIQLDDGATLPVHAVIAGVGVRPATQLLAGLKLDQDGGVSVDASMCAAPRVYVAGDIARFPLADGSGLARTARIEHWRVAQQLARVAALNMLEREVRYEGVPFFWTEHFGQRVDYLGHATQWDDLDITGSLAEGRFRAIYSRLGHVQAVLACGYEHAAAHLIERMREPITADVARAVFGA
ncbi:FAD-dependent oxidoreductase [Paraburkholderia sp. J94]|uniref:FAD-dependent oxidoreductase n=1 Tax=Paraburkholderia sp. J94 TaxID=2805441 RepID=UPI002AB00700|nr:FAD-dependent oxidoreductase [Paraburkholderia sp. J94]